MNKFLTSLLIFISAFFLFSITNVSAKVISNDKGSVNIAKNEVINDDLFVGAETVEIGGTVNGDVFIGAQTVKITGIINGSLHVGANILVLDGTVKGNVYAGAQSVLVSGSTIGGSLLIGAATVNIDKDSSVGGSILAGAGTLSVDSQVKRSVYAGTGSLTIGSNAKIGKDLYYASGKDQGQVNISGDAKIAGSIYKSETYTAKSNINIEGVKKQTSAVFGKIKVVASIISFVGALIVGFLYLKLFEKHLTQSVGLVSKSFWKTLGIGFLVTIALVPGLIILLITVIGIPLAGLALLMFLLYSYLAKIVVGMTFGNWISQKLNWKMPTYGTLAFGLFVFYLIKQIHVIGFLAGLVVLWIGLGALTLHIFTKAD
ncbi:hypothetical protein A2Z67_02210 [Candidatus Woesebacteria bacterium RBG_13_36_22]|uniref:DUF8173 domain-containing protein n=1 Tax=Candidatus Woesebacteria bacterium RBG_13_36_22 TaxID=1802478 RepID=A0A1F7X0B7_9BACT|nr:MAG: hypothetical protein A2Z67_02210 [Candidatus Woesebacteria bacterium RBG_13_36_22]